MKLEKENIQNIQNNYHSLDIELFQNLAQIYIKITQLYFRQIYHIF